MPRKADDPPVIASARTLEYAARFSGEDGFEKFLDLAYERMRYVPPRRVHRAMAKRMQYGPRKQVILAPRSAAKSTVAACYADWRLLTDPQDKIVCISKSARHARKWTSAVLKVVRHLDFMKHLAPKPGQRRSTMDFEVSEAQAGAIHSSVAAFGIETQIAGAKGTVVIPDDVETPENARTDPSRDVLDAQVRDFINLAVPGKEIRIIYLGTPHSPDQSLYLKLKERGYSIWAWPICYPSEELLAEMKGYLAPELLEDIERDPSLMRGGPIERVGKITDPEWFTAEDVKDRVEEGWEQFLTQSMMCLTVADPTCFTFRCRDLPVVSLMPEIGPEVIVPSNEAKFAIADLTCPGLMGDSWYSPSEVKGAAPFAWTVMSIDPSGEGEDETAYAIVAAGRPYQFLLDCGGFRAGFAPDTLEALARAVLRWRVTTIFDEKNYGGGTFRELFRGTLRRICEDPQECATFGIRAPWICGFDEDGYTRLANKERWIFNVMSPVVQNHLLVVNRTLVEADNRFGYPGMTAAKSKQYRLFQQLTRFNGLKDSLPFIDRLDALAYAVFFNRNLLATQAEKEMKQRQDARDQQELEEWMESGGGFKDIYRRGPSDPSYFATNRVSKYMGRR